MITSVCASDRYLPAEQFGHGQQLLTFNLNSVRPLAVERLVINKRNVVLARNCDTYECQSIQSDRIETRKDLSLQGLCHISGLEDTDDLLYIVFQFCP